MNGVGEIERVRDEEEETGMSGVQGRLEERITPEGSNDALL